MLTPMLSDIILLVLLLVVLWLAFRPARSAREREVSVRLETRLDEQSKHIHTLEQRLAEIQTQQVNASATLREQLVERFEILKHAVSENLADGRTQIVRSLGELREELQRLLSDHRTRFEQRQGEAIKTLQEGLQTGITSVQNQVADALSRNAEELGKRLEGLTQSTDKRLEQISGEVERRLTEGFEKTTATFADILKRLALIDEAQKKITELSTNVVSLQEILADKRSRGAYGEVQLSALVRNVMPEASFALQYTLPNDKVVDCMLFLPEPTGTVAIDAKFPLESYRRMTDISLAETNRKEAERQFKQDIRKHIQDIAEKYIVPGTTSDGAVMFIPAEAVFAEIQAHHADLVEEANSSRVWMVSPTTLWAILNTARAVLKDAATREQVDIIQEHLGYLAKDFERFQHRMDALSRHIAQAHNDVKDVHKSARKISSRFAQIERVELEEVKRPALPVDQRDELT
ncbi:MAG: DNA recombination protein RmuC [Gammaproteobacteria bacterium]|nr:DNA recombination protein RmuC [Gammaproteobacteria bacterium]MCI0591596.1 DNA recombination protein RmuC [Gammaproteobacteria bacterium]